MSSQAIWKYIIINITAAKRPVVFHIIVDRPSPPYNLKVERISTDTGILSQLPRMTYDEVTRLAGISTWLPRSPPMICLSYRNLSFIEISTSSSFECCIYHVLRSFISTDFRQSYVKSPRPGSLRMGRRFPDISRNYRSIGCRSWPNS